MLSPQNITNQELESRLKNLVQRERQLLHIILEHICELNTRKIYLERAYSSLYEYLTKELGYSGSAAMRRIEAARLLKDVPVVAEKIQEGTLNLSQIGELSRAIKEKENISGLKVSSLQKEVLLTKIVGKTTSETQKELAVALDIPVKDIEKQKIQQDDSVRIELTFTKEQYQKMLDCRDLAAHLLEQNHRDTSWTSVFEVLADQFLDKRSSRKSLQKDADLVGVDTNETTASESRRINKTLTIKTRKTIFHRDSCCQYKDPKTGRQCRSTFGLQIDHRTSQWAGGKNNLENLQVLCRQHNRFKYQKEAGVNYKR